MKMVSEKNDNPMSISPLNLAFIGDSVYEILVRERLLSIANRPVNELNKLKTGYVNASAQANAIDKLMPSLTENEVYVYKRGRNAHSNGVRKSSTVAEYHKATGLEALFGYLYLCGDIDRINELFEIILN